MFKKFVNILWTYSLQDYWRALRSKTSLDEKAIATLKELQDVGKAIKEVGSQLEDIDDAMKGRSRKGRKKKEVK